MADNRQAFYGGGNPTIVDVLRQKLPLHTTEAEWKTASTSSTTTANFIAPTFLINWNAAQFENRADDALNSKKVILSHLVKTDGPMEPPSGFTLKTEGDVVRFAETQMIFSIGEVLDVLYPGLWTIQSEVQTKTKGKDKDKTQAQTQAQTQTKAGSDKEDDIVCRFDIIFQTKGTDAEPPKPIAILEYKRVGGIRTNDFKMAIVRENASTAEIKAFKNDAVEKGIASQIKANGLKYTKQAGKYAADQECPYVAVFNWHHLFLYHFSELMEVKNNGKKNTAGQTAKVCWVSEGPKLEGFAHAQEGVIRKALLGWLLFAFKEALGEPSM